MVVADVDIELGLAEGAPYVVNVIVYIVWPGQARRPAEDGEAEARLLDIPEIPDGVIDETPWRITVGGRVPFNVTEFPWIVGWDKILVGANRMQIQVRLTADHSVYKQQDILLGTDMWSYPPLGFARTISTEPQVMVVLATSFLGGLALLYLSSRK